MRSLLLTVLMVPLLAACRDWDKELSTCISSGKCGEVESLVWLPSGSFMGDFGDVPTGALVVATYSLTNLGDTAVQNVASKLGGADSAVFGFLDGDSCARLELKPGEECSLRVGFVPTAERFFSAQLSATSSRGPSLAEQVQGSGIVPTYRLDVALSQAQAFTVTYKDSRIGTYTRPCQLPGGCYFAFLEPTTLTIDVGLEGAGRGPMWGGDCASAVGQKCELSLSAGKPTAAVQVSFFW